MDLPHLVHDNVHRVMFLVKFSSFDAFHFDRVSHDNGRQDAQKGKRFAPESIHLALSFWCHCLQCDDEVVALWGFAGLLDRCA